MTSATASFRNSELGLTYIFYQIIAHKECFSIWVTGSWHHHNFQKGTKVIRRSAETKILFLGFCSPPLFLWILHVKNAKGAANTHVAGKWMMLAQYRRSQACCEFFRTVCPPCQTFKQLPSHPSWGPFPPALISATVENSHLPPKCMFNNSHDYDLRMDLTLYSDLWIPWLSLFNVTTSTFS